MSKTNIKKKKKYSMWKYKALVNYQHIVIVTKMLTIKYILYKLMLYSNYNISYIY